MTTPQTAIRVGTSWTCANGRTWTVYETKPFGRASVRSGMRFGEMRFSDIHAAMRGVA